jgi:myo-inosose-2 dehydratase
MSIRLGTNPIAWSNDDLRTLGGTTPLETCLAEARQAGFAGIELGHKFPRDVGALRAVLDRHGLALVSGWYSSNLLQRDATEEMAAMRPHLELLRALGCEVLILAETTGAVHSDQAIPLSRRPVMPSGEWSRFAARLTELARMTRDAGLRIAYHHHMGTVVQTGAEIDRLMTETNDALGLLLDTGHATFAGADPVALAQAYRARIVHVHCKDVRSAVMADCLRKDRSFLHSVIEGVFTGPGDGAIDFAAVLRALPGYAGWLVVEAEQDPAKAHPLTYAQKGHDTLAHLVGD